MCVCQIWSFSNCIIGVNELNIRERDGIEGGGDRVVNDGLRFSGVFEWRMYQYGF